MQGRIEQLVAFLLKRHVGSVLFMVWLTVFITRSLA